MQSDRETADYRRLLVLSYLKVARLQYVPKNTFEAFFPFIVAAADPRQGLLYEPYPIAERIRSSLGWNVGGDFVELFTDDLERRGQLTPENGLKQRYWTAGAARPSDDHSDEEIEHLKASFHQFTEKLSGALLHNVDADERLFALANALVSNRLFSLDALEEYAGRVQQQDITTQSARLAVDGILSGAEIDWSGIVEMRLIITRTMFYSIYVGLALVARLFNVAGSKFCRYSARYRPCRVGNCLLHCEIVRKRSEAIGAQCSY